MSEAELFYRMSEDRLRGRCRWAGIALTLGVLIPYEVVDEQPQMLWQLFGELPPSGVVAGLASTAAGVTVLVARRTTHRATSLAVIVLGALAVSALLHKLGADASAWGHLPLPPSFAGRATLALCALCATAAGANLSAQPATHMPSRALLALGLALTLLFYAWPGRGEAPGVTVLNNLAAIADMPTVHFKIGAITLSAVALWPAIVALAGLTHVWRPASRSVSLLGMVALFGFPLLLTMLLFSWYLRASPGSAMFYAAGAAVEITAVLALGAAALETLGHGAFSRDKAEHAEPGGWSIVRAAGATVIAAGALVATQAWLARPLPKGVRWTLSEPSDTADELFGDIVVRWSDARYLWDLRVRRDSSASELIEVKALGNDMVAAARSTAPALGEAFAELSRAGARLDASSRTWYRLVAGVNAASLDRGLPYYLDPRVGISKTKDGLRRHLLVDTYRIVRVRRFSVDGDEHATLHVRGIGTLRAGHRLGMLGFSRDVQPFALVVTDTIEHHFDQLSEGARDVPPRCGRAFDPTSEGAMLQCGEMLAEMMKDVDNATRASIDEVERHELQHQIDGPLLTLARPVLRKLAGYTDEAQERVNRELSAYVAQLTRASKLGLILPLRFVLLDDGGTYHHAGVLLFEALSDRTVRDAAGRVDPALVLEVFEDLARLDDDGLAARARAAWERLYGDELPDVVALDEQVAPEAGALPSATAVPEEEP